MNYFSETTKFQLLVDRGFIAAWISSKVLPLVSGTNFATNKTVKPQMLENMKKIPSKVNRNNQINIP